MISIRADLQNALPSWAANQREADDAARDIFEVVMTLHRQFPQIPRGQLDLFLADDRRATEDVLDRRITGTVHVDEAVHTIVQRFSEKTEEMRMIQHYQPRWPTRKRN